MSVSRILPLLLLAACSRAPDQPKPVAESVDSQQHVTAQQRKTELLVISKLPFPCCNPDEPVGFFDSDGN
jgi:PBP1b-binding outer membrane lipoprotein LpoB